MRRPKYRNKIPINVLSVFDGKSCGLEALKRERFNVGNYYASEVDKYASAVARFNHPEVIHLGDATKWKEWNLPHIDMVIGGPPCQDYSGAGLGAGILGEKGKLTKTFLDIIDYVKPTYFLMEQVTLRGKHKPVIPYISNRLDTEMVNINSDLVSGQNRDRLYWCNWEVGQPDDKHIMLKDIIETGFVDRRKSLTLTASYRFNPQFYEYVTQRRKQIVFTDKSQTILSTIYKENAKSMITRNKRGLLVLDKEYWRKLTPLECERLQTLNDDYTKTGTFLPGEIRGKKLTVPIADTNRYKMIGNGWTVDVISHILEYIPYF